MSWTPTDEQVEEAGQALYERHRTPGDTPAWEGLFSDDARGYWRDQARAVLVAVGPMIAAQAWDDCYSTAYSDTGYLVNDPNNPYIEKEAGR